MWTLGHICIVLSPGPKAVNTSRAFSHFCNLGYGALASAIPWPWDPGSLLAGPLTHLSKGSATDTSSPASYET